MQARKNSERELVFNHAFLSTNIYLIIERNFCWGVKKNSIRQRFRSEYLGQLRENSQLKDSENRKLCVGDLVLIGSDDSKRIALRPYYICICWARWSSTGVSS